jgi:hypothetical protein
VGIVKDPAQRSVEDHERAEGKDDHPSREPADPGAQPTHQIRQLLRDDTTDKVLAADLEPRGQSDLAQALLRVAVANV